MMQVSTTDQRHLFDAAQLALRGHGLVEPNPMVGCVIASRDGKRIAAGHHRRFGGPHAEVEALMAAGPRARGATAYVTLEPCSHFGKTPPCTRSLIDAGIERVVIARRDPHHASSGGAEILRDAGIKVDIFEGILGTRDPARPFLHRLQTGMPYVIAKWAQTLDGRTATRSGESQWISSLSSRRLVHRQRGRVDVILTAIGTVLADNPALTARCRNPRRTPRRVVIDPKLQIPVDSTLVTTIDEAPLSVACHQSMLDSKSPLARALETRGVELIGIPHGNESLPLAPLLRELVARHDAMTILTECGSNLLGRLFSQALVNEAWVFTAPLLMADEQATPAVRGKAAHHLSDAVRLTPIDLRHREGDLVTRYSVDSSTSASP